MKNTNNSATLRVKNGYRPIIGDGYQPIPTASAQASNPIPAGVIGGTGARAIPTPTQLISPPLNERK